jgi:hypothetical protein
MSEDRMAIKSFYSLPTQKIDGHNLPSTIHHSPSTHYPRCLVLHWGGLVVQRSPEKVTEYREGIIKRKGAKAWLDSFSKKQNHIKKWLRPNYIVNYSSNLVNG